MVTNVGHDPVDIEDVSINGRKDCGPRVGILEFFQANSSGQPWKVGEMADLGRPAG